MKKKKNISIITIFSLFLLFLPISLQANSKNLKTTLLNQILESNANDFLDIQLISKELNIDSSGIKYKITLDKHASYLTCSFCLDEKCETSKSNQKYCSIPPEYYEKGKLTVSACSEPIFTSQETAIQDLCIRVIDNLALDIDTKDFSDELLEKLEIQHAKDQSITQLGATASGLVFLSKESSTSCDNQALDENFKKLTNSILSSLSPDNATEIMKYLGYPFEKKTEIAFANYLSKNDLERFYGACETQNSSFALLGEGGENQANFLRRGMNLFQSAVRSITSSTQNGANLAKTAATTAAKAAGKAALNGANVVGNVSLEGGKRIIAATAGGITAGLAGVVAGVGAGVTGNLNPEEVKKYYEILKKYGPLLKPSVDLSKLMYENYQEIQKLLDKDQKVNLNSAEDSNKAILAIIERAKDKAKQTKNILSQLNKIKQSKELIELQKSPEYKALTEALNVDFIRETPDDFYERLHVLLGSSNYQKFIQGEDLQILANNLGKVFEQAIEIENFKSFDKAPKLLVLFTRFLSESSKGFSALTKAQNTISSALDKANTDLKSQQQNFDRILSSSKKIGFLSSITLDEMDILKDPENSKFSETYDRLYKKWENKVSNDPETKSEISRMINDFKALFPAASGQIDELDLNTKSSFDIALTNYQISLQIDDHKIKYEDVIQIRKKYLDLQRSNTSMFQSLWTKGKKALGKYSVQAEQLLLETTKVSEMVTHLAKPIHDNKDIIEKIASLRNDLKNPSPDWDLKFEELENASMNFFKLFYNDTFLTKANVIHHNLEHVEGLTEADRRILRAENPSINELKPVAEKALLLKAMSQHKETLKLTMKDLKNLKPDEIKDKVRAAYKKANLTAPRLNALGTEAANQVLQQHIKKFPDIISSDLAQNLIHGLKFLQGKKPLERIPDLIKTAIGSMKGRFKWSAFTSQISNLVANDKLAGNWRLTPKNVQDLFKKNKSISSKIVKGITGDIVAEFAKTEMSDLVKALIPGSGSSTVKDLSNMAKHQAFEFINSESFSDTMAIPVYYHSTNPFDRKKVRERIIEIKIGDPLTFSRNEKAMKLLAKVINFGNQGELEGFGKLAKKSDINKTVKDLQVSLGKKGFSVKNIESFKGKNIALDHYNMKTANRIRLGLTDNTQEDLREDFEKIHTWTNLSQKAFSNNEIEIGSIFFAQILKLQFQYFAQSSCQSVQDFTSAIESITRKQEQLYLNNY